MRDILDSKEARANREANHPEIQGAAQEDDAADPQTAAVEEEPRAHLGPLGAFFKRRADFFEQEATLLAIQLERMWQQDTARPKE